jgi:nucleoside-diphosphate kinase
MERTLVIVKPDAIQRGLAGEILSRLERRGLKIVGMKLTQIDEALARRHYAEHEGKDFLPGLIRFITSCPVIVAAFEGKGAVTAVRQTMGVTDPMSADVGTIRGDLGLEIGRNLIHGSDSPESAQKELALFFEPTELLSYKRDLDGWIGES